MFNFNPKEDKFFTMFINEANNIKEAAKLLKIGFEDITRKEEISKLVGELEHKGDVMVHDYILELNDAFITPIDREDVYKIIKKMDDVLDEIDSASNRLIMYDVEEGTKESLVMCDMIIEITSELVDLMEELKNIGRRNSVLAKVKAINIIEHKGDKFYRETIKELFKKQNPIDIIKWKDIYVLLEGTLDNCEQVAAIVEGVVMKHA